MSVTCSGLWDQVKPEHLKRESQLSTLKNSLAALLLPSQYCDTTDYWCIVGKHILSANKATFFALVSTTDLLFFPNMQEMAAIEVAQLMHQLFTNFDSAVTEAGLYKV